MNNVIPFKLRNLNQKTRGKHEKCPTCCNLMKRIYIKSQYAKKATMKAIGWVCLQCLNVKLDD
ncbi:hypothetical protein DRO97_07645 [Archaeoglobales archaeon]|nr:MAG: hypothetical protein DRO97_07645 [Archaeoglobales archaeon]